MHLNNSLIFLDFDGVICDSVRECFVSSWIAYSKDYYKDNLTSIKIEYKNNFIGLRPFIRSGEDYLLIHDLLLNNIKIKNQEEFDFYIVKTGKIRMEEYKESLYKVRNSLLEQEKDFWLSLNYLYPHMKLLLSKYYSHKNLYIISTKKQKLIIEILNSNNIKISPDRVYDSGKSRKLDIVSDIMEKTKVQDAVLIDDQIDHLSGNNNKRIEVYLAKWGYIKNEWLKKQENIKILRKEKISDFFI